MRRALILLACLLAACQAVPVQTEQEAQEEGPPQPQQLQDAPPFLQQPQEQISAGGSDPSAPSRSVYYPVPPAAGFLGMDYFQQANWNPYTMPYSGLYNYNYGYPYGGNYPSGYPGYPYANLQNTLHPLLQNQLQTGYAYPPIVINLPNRAGQN
ncbi:uncharacterized protein wu:fk95d07 [Engraulis encrasicolus]|uniref:uncharacterized protein wu:fk95d07 n=1 Tax=Engraulis encrasicolus TaxID=184585 RepID=UPI002FD61A96